MSRTDRIVFTVCVLVVGAFTVALTCWGLPLY